MHESILYLEKCDISFRAGLQYPGYNYIITVTIIEFSLQPSEGLLGTDIKWHLAAELNIVIVN